MINIEYHFYVIILLKWTLHFNDSYVFKTTVWV